MATDLDTLIVRLSADTAGLQAEMKKANDAIAKAMVDANRRFEQARAGAEKLTNFMSGALRTALAGLSVRKIVDMTRETLEWSKATLDVSRTLGTTTDFLQEMEVAGSKVGLTMEQTRDALARLAKALAETAAGKGEAKDLFDALGLGARDAGGQVKSLTAFIPELANKLKSLGQGDQYLVGLKMFGEKNAGFVDALKQGADGLRAMGEEARRTGQILNYDLIRANAELANKLIELERASGQSLREALSNLAPLLIRLSELGRDAAKAIGDLAESMKDLDERSTATIRKELDMARQELEIRKKAADAGRISKPSTAWDRGFLGEEIPGDRWGLREMDDPSLAESIRVREDALRRRAMQQDADRKRADRTPATSSTLSILSLDQNAKRSAEQLQKIIEDLEAANSALFAEIRDGGSAAAAEYEKLAQKLAKLSPTAEQQKAIKDLFDNNQALQFQKTIVDINRDSEKQQAIQSAIVSGNQDLIPIIEAQFAAKQRFTNLGEKELADLAAAVRLNEDMKKAVDRAKASADELRNTFNSVADIMGTAMVDTIFDSANAWKIWQNAAMAALREVLNELIKLSLTNPLKNMIPGNNYPTIGGFGDIFGSLFGSGAESAASLGAGVAGGFLGFAEGGPVKGGVPIIVGEKGPELWVPPGDGKIIPNDQLRVPATFDLPAWNLGAANNNATGQGECGCKTIVTINNQSGAQATATEKQPQIGIREIEVFISNAAAKDVKTGGPLARSIENTFGQRRSGVTR